MGSKRLEKKIAAFLKRVRGEETYRAFARKLGMTPSMLFRFEQCEASMTLDTLQRILSSLQVSLSDVVGHEEAARKWNRRDL